MSADDRPLYVMDDDYIEQKYVRAEEERQKKEEEDRARKEIEEREAFEEAERQRKAAEIERKRREAEKSRQDQLEAAKKRRDEEEKKRKDQEAKYQAQIADIEAEMNDLEIKKANYAGEKVNVGKEQNTELEVLRGELEEILSEKATLLEREQAQRKKIAEYNTKIDGQKRTIEAQEKAGDIRLKELVQQRRNLQTLMLNLLNQPLSAGSVAPLSSSSVETPKAPIEPIASPSVTPGPSSPMGQMPDPAGFYPNMSMMGGPMPTAPLYTMQGAQYMAPAQPAPENPNVRPNFVYPSYPTPTKVPANPKPNLAVQPKPAPVQKDDLTEQLEMLDKFLEDAVLTREEYEANKKELLVSHGLMDKEQPKPSTSVPSRANVGGSSNSPPSSSTSGTGNPNVDAQIRQLDEYLRSGVLQKNDYDDAKNRVLRDAGLQPPLSGTSSVPLPTAMPAVRPPSGSTLVSVVVPYNKRPGQEMLITYQGNNFNVKIPPGVVPGMTFQASVPNV